MKNVNIKALIGAALVTTGNKVTVSWAPWKAARGGWRSRSVWASQGSLPEKLVELAEGLLSITTPSGNPFWVLVEVGGQTVFDGLGCVAG